MQANGHRNMSSRQAASLLLEWGVVPIPVPLGSKQIVRIGWEQETHPASDFDGTNVGVLLGERSQNLVDVDLDWLEAVEAGPFFLPSTNCKWGHDSKPNSHWLYRVASLGNHRNIPYSDPTVEGRGTRMIVELRVHGQTVGPGSRHPSGEPIVPVSEFAEPPTVSYDELLVAATRTATVALLARHWREGTRHALALALAGTLCRGGLSRSDATLMMRAICHVAHDSDTPNRLACVESTYERHAHGQPIESDRALQNLLDSKVIVVVQKWLRLTDVNAPGALLGPDGFQLNDVGNALRFAGMWSDQVRHSDPERTWYTLTDGAWIANQRLEHVDNAMTTNKRFRELALQSSNIPTSWVKHAEYLSSRRGIDNMLELAKPLLSISPEEFDADPYLFNTRNGTLELNVQTGEVHLRDHRAEDFITMVSHASYVPGASHPLFDDYLARFFPEPERRQLLQHLAGYMLTGLPKNYALQLIGPTNSGKSMTLDLFAHMMGSYAGHLRYDSLKLNPHSGGDVARPDLAGIVRKRLVIISEVPEDIRFDTATFKALTGGDALRIRNLYERSGGRSVYFPSCMWMSGNQPYGPQANDDAAYERLVTLKCAHQVPSGERNRVLQQQAIQETADAALWFAVQGFQDLYARHHGNVPIPEEARLAKEELRDAKDTWTDIINGLFEFTGDANDIVVKDESWTHARFQFEQAGGVIHNVTKARDSFCDSMARRGANEFRSSRVLSNVRCWRGVRWSPAAPQNVTRVARGS